MLRADLAALDNQPLVAEKYYRRAIDAASEIRNQSPEHAGYLAASRRSPYDGLFELRAKQGRWADALAVLLELDVIDRLRLTASPGQLAPDGLFPRGNEGRVAAVSLVDTSVTPPALPDVLSTWKGRDLVVLVPISWRLFDPGERVWRLDVIDGVVSGGRQTASELSSKEGPFAAFARSLLGDVKGSSEPLYVLVMGELARIPLAVLRKGARPSVAARPLARVLSLIPPEAPKAWSERTVVVGNPRGDLPEAAAEAKWVAKRLQTTALLEPEATRSAVLSARGGEHSSHRSAFRCCWRRPRTASCRRRLEPN